MSIVWVKGVVGRLTRIVPHGAYLPVDRWTQTEMTKRIRQKHERGSLELSFVDPDRKPAAKAAIKEDKE